MWYHGLCPWGSMWDTVLKSEVIRQACRMLAVLIATARFRHAKESRMESLFHSDRNRQKGYS